MRVLDLFAGTGSATQAFQDRGHQVIRVEVDKQFVADYRDVMELDWQSLGHFDFIWASPPCTAFSVASIGHYWNKDGTPNHAGAHEGLNLVQQAITIIKGLKPTYGFIIENPRGMLRKMAIMQEFDKTTVTYCQYGDSRMKPTDLFGFVKGWTPKTPCRNGDSCHERAPRGSRTGTQGIRGAKNRSKIPYELGVEICQAIERHARD